MKNPYKIFFIILLFVKIMIAQNVSANGGQWRSISFNGLVALESIYRSQENYLRNGTKETPITKRLFGQLRLDSRSYIWHPSFLQVNFFVDWHPGVRNQAFLVMPDRTETRTAEQLRLQLEFFNKRPLGLQFFTNFSHGYANRDFATNVEMTQKDFGTMLSFRNAIAPLTVNYLYSDWLQNELATGRQFKNNRRRLDAEVKKSFSSRDQHSLTYSYNDYKRIYGNYGFVHNIIGLWRLKDGFYFSKDRQSALHSNIYFQDQTGSQIFRRLQVYENFKYTLPVNFKSFLFYRYLNHDENVYFLRQHNIKGQLTHQLYQSLRSSAYYEYINIKHSSYKQYTSQGGVGFNYIKNIPGGQLALGYNYRRRHDNRNVRPGVLQILREEHEMNDNEIVLLNNPYVDVNSVVVKDESGTIIYRENIDYLLIEQGVYTEIRRLSGGQIANGQTVYVDYISNVPLSFDFATNTNGFNASVKFLKRLMELYYRFYNQNYDNVNELSVYKVLKTINQNVYGVRISKNIFTLGYEFDNYQSNIIPYRSNRIFLTMSGNIVRRLSGTVNASHHIRDLTATKEIQKFSDVSGRLVYNINRLSSLSLSGGYRFQVGRGLDLNLVTIVAEYNILYRSFNFIAGAELYRRNFQGERINYNGGYVRIQRTF